MSGQTTRKCGINVCRSVDNYCFCELLAQQLRLQQQYITKFEKYHVFIMPCGEQPFQRSSADEGTGKTTGAAICIYCTIGTVMQIIAAETAFPMYSSVQQKVYRYCRASFSVSQGREHQQSICCCNS